MRRISLFVCVFFFITIVTFAQSLTDSIIPLKEVTISIYPSKPLLLHSTTSVLTLDERALKDHSQLSFTPAVNSLSGVRMEERSPGSYRLSIRGSLLRSPFGIRNIKIYMDEFLLTDAGGNTYLNLIDPNTLKNILVLKGPEGSMFGANTGGVVVLGTENKNDSIQGMANFSAGSYNTYKEHIYLQSQWKKYSIQVNQSYQRSEGYRTNSAMERNSMQLLQKIRYKKGTLKALLIGSMLKYETPGGLSLSQYNDDPTMARPATTRLPGAEEQKAGIYNSTVYGGISNEIYLLPELRHVITIFGSYTDFKNPFITNYETRIEKTHGLRTYLNLQEKFEMIRINWNIGFEYAATGSRISNFDNIKGTKGSLRVKDELQAGQYFYFSQLSALITTRLQLEIAASLNNNSFSYKNIYPDDEANSSRVRLNTQLLPRAGISWRIINNLVWRTSVSKGYSPPTIAEIRPSDNNIYQNLQSEYGWNYETGLRFKSLDARLEADIAIFRFDLQDAIVRRVNDEGAEYFINAGGTRQQGLEVQTFFQLINPNTKSFIRECYLRAAYTYYYFYFSDYKINTMDYSGNELTGIPQQVINTGLRIEFPAQLYLFSNYNYTGRISLTDDNTVYSDPYHLIFLKAGWKYFYRDKAQIELFVGIDNLLDASYSLGNDLNAAAGRYYNPAPGRNLLAGLSLKF
jgi:iron complex outermembrane receptor protein